MKFKYYLFLTLKNLKQKKINILNVILITIVITLTIVICSFSRTFSNLIDSEINGDMKKKALLVNDIESVQELQKEFSNNREISYIIDYNEFSSYVQTDKGEVLTFIGVPNNYLKILSGENLSKSGDKTLICPSKFYLGNKPGEINDDYLKNVKDGINYLKKDLNIKSDWYYKKYKIVGIYDVNKYLYGEYNVCFTNFKNILEINNNFAKYMEEQCKIDENFCSDGEKFPQAVVVVNKIDNLSMVEEQLNDYGYRTIRISSVNTDGIDFFINIIMIIPIIILIIAFIILLCSNNKFIMYNKKNNVIYKALGYDDKILVKINYLESVILAIIGFFMSILICIILYLIIINKCSAQITLQMPIKISYISVGVSFILTLTASLLSMYLAIKNNGSIMGEFNDVEI